jgi:hypothetical protein
VRTRILLLSTVALLSFGAPAVAAPERVDLEAARAAAQEGNRAYEDHDWAAAVESYERSLEFGLDHATVHYNLGNAYFKRGDLGLAIASYERARRLAPRNADAKTNLARARAQIQDVELSSHEPPAFLRPLYFLLSSLSLDEWWTLALAAWVMGLALAILRHWSPARATVLARGVIVCGAAFAIALGAGTLRYDREVLRHEAVVVVEEIEVRSGPGVDYNLSFRVHEGLQVHVAETRGDWVRIDLGGELVGWVPAAQIESL